MIGKSSVTASLAVAVFLSVSCAPVQRPTTRAELPEEVQTKCFVNSNPHACRLASDKAGGFPFIISQGAGDGQRKGR